MIVFFTLILLLMFKPGGEIVIKEQWLRPSAKKMTTALYFTIVNETDEPDTLYSVKSYISDKIEIHETYSSGDMMGMREIGLIVIGAGEEVKLEPGGKHVMVMKLKRDINIDDNVKFELFFNNAGLIKISAKAIFN